MYDALYIKRRLVLVESLSDVMFFCKKKFMYSKGWMYSINKFYITVLG